MTAHHPTQQQQLDRDCHHAYPNLRHHSPFHAPAHVKAHLSLTPHQLPTCTKLSRPVEDCDRCLALAGVRHLRLVDRRAIRPDLPCDFGAASHSARRDPLIGRRCQRSAGDPVLDGHKRSDRWTRGVPVNSHGRPRERRQRINANPGTYQAAARGRWDQAARRESSRRC
jgi:hypothetical protein